MDNNKNDFDKKSDKFEPPKNQKPRGSLFGSILTWLIIIGVIVLVIQFMSGQFGGPPEEKPGTLTLRQLIEAGRVKKLILQKDEIKATYTDPSSQDGEKELVLKGITNEERNDIRKFAEEHNVNPIPEQKSEILQTILIYLLPTLIIIAIFYFLFIRQLRAAGGGGVLSFGKSRARLVSKDRPRVTFNDVAGIDEAKEEVEEIIAFLKNPGKFTRLGGRIPRGILLVGAPGTGKTLLAKAIAGEANVPFFSISGSDFVEMFVGVGASRVRDLFKQAKESAPCIIFLDEIDAVGRRRGYGFGGGHDEREQTLNAILVEMDGFETDTGVIIIAATNRPDVLDRALLRPGRFDREIIIDLPDLKGREEILKVHARKVKLANSVDFKVLARGTPMFTGAELEAIINEAALIATMRGKSAVEMEDLEEARDKIRWGKKKTSRIMDEQDKRITAYHEGGHALMAKLLPETEPLHKVTIVPRGMALGSTMQLPERDRYLLQRKNILANVMVMLAGRVSEKLFCDDISSGAENDIKQATEFVRKMVREWGMSDKIGPVNYEEESDGNIMGDFMISKKYSEATSVAIDNEVKRILTDCYNRSRALLEQNQDKLKVIAEALLKYEALDAKEVELLLEGKDLDAIKSAAALTKAEKNENKEKQEEKHKEGMVIPSQVEKEETDNKEQDNLIE